MIGNMLATIFFFVLGIAATITSIEKWSKDWMIAATCFYIITAILVASVWGLWEEYSHELKPSNIWGKALRLFKD